MTGGIELTKKHILYGMLMGIFAGIAAGLVAGVMLKYTYDSYLKEPPMRRKLKSIYKKAFCR